MSTQSVERDLQLQKGQRDAIAAALLAGMVDIYSAQIRLLLQRSGYGDHELTVDEAGVIAALSFYAQQRADVIIRWYNHLLHGEVSGLPGGLTDEQMLAALAPFLQSVHAYNAQTLVPYIAKWTQQRAVEDFFTKNGIAKQALWELSPGTTDQTDICLEAIEAGRMTYEEAQPYFGVFPAHQNCPHFLTPVFTTAVSFPRTFWTGSSGTGLQAEAA